MLTHEKGMSKTEFFLVLMVILLPALYFYTSEFIKVKKEKESFIEIEKNFVKTKVNEYITKHPKEIVISNNELLSCTNAISAQICKFNLNYLVTKKMVSPNWKLTLHDYPEIKWNVDLVIKSKEQKIDINVRPETTPDYTNATFKTLNNRLLSILNK